MKLPATRLVPLWMLTAVLTLLVVAQSLGQAKSNKPLKHTFDYSKPASSAPFAGTTNTPNLVEQGNQYRLSEGVPQDEAKAAELYHQAAEQGSTIGQTLYGEA